MSKFQRQFRHKDDVEKAETALKYIKERESDFLSKLKKFQSSSAKHEKSLHSVKEKQNWLSEWKQLTKDEQTLEADVRELCESSIPQLQEELSQMSGQQAQDQLEMRQVVRRAQQQQQQQQKHQNQSGRNVEQEQEEVEVEQDDEQEETVYESFCRDWKRLVAEYQSAQQELRSTTDQSNWIARETQQQVASSSSSGGVSGSVSSRSRPQTHQSATRPPVERRRSRSTITPRPHSQPQHQQQQGITRPRSLSAVTAPAPSTSATMQEVPVTARSRTSSSSSSSAAGLLPRRLSQPQLASPDDQQQLYAALAKSVQELDESGSQLVVEQLYERQRSLVESILSEHRKYVSESYHECVQELRAHMTEEDHYHFVKLYKQYKRSGVKVRSKTVEACCREMPRHSKQLFEQHFDCYVRLHCVKLRQSELEDEYERALLRLSEERAALLEQVWEQIRVRSENEESRIRQQEKVQQLHQKLNHLKEEQQVQRMERDRLKLAAEQKNVQELEKWRQREQERRKEIKQRLHRYKATLAEQQQEQERKQEEKEQEQQVVFEQQAKYNRDRVKYRVSKYQESVQLRHNRLALLQEQEADRRQRMDALAAMVAPSVKPDPKRVLQPTEASQPQHVYSEYQFTRVDGYNIKQLMSDERYRLADAFSRAGLFHSDFARAAISTAIPATMPRFDTFHAEQLQRHGSGV